MIQALALLGLVWGPPPQDEQEIKEALKQLTSEYYDDRVKALKVLERAGKKAEPYLIEALESDEPRVQIHAIRLLAKLLSKRPLHKIGPLFRRGPGIEVRDAAFDYLLAVPAEAEDYLIPALEHRRADYRKRALAALKTGRSKKAVPTVAKLYARELDPKIKEAAFKFLVNMGEAAEDELIRLLDHRSSEIREKVLKEGLFGSTSPKVVRAVGELFIDEPNPEVLKRAKVILVKRYRMEDSVSEQYFIKALEKGTRAAQKYAVRALHQQDSVAGIEPAGELMLRNREPVLRDLLVRYLTPSEDGIPFFRRALTAGNPGLATEALIVLTEKRDFESIEAVADLYQRDAPERLRVMAIRYLRESGAREIEQVLTRALKDRAESIRTEAIEGLGRLQTPTAIAALARQLSNSGTSEQQRIRDALSRLKAAALLAILNSDEAKDIPEELRAQIRSLHAAVAVEEHLDACVARGEGIGTYAGQFEELLEEPLEADGILKILRGMIQPQYNYITDPTGAWPVRYRRQLAFLALADLGGEAEAATLHQVWTDDVSRYTGMSQIDMKLALAVALHRVGHTDVTEELSKWMERFAKEQLDSKSRAGELLAHEVWFYRAMLMSRVGKLAEALKLYTELATKVADMEPPYKAVAPLHYNIACLQARLGKSSDAIEALGRAIEEGFKDRAWIERDRDLDALRDLDAFKELLKQLPE